MFEMMHLLLYVIVDSLLQFILSKAVNMKYRMLSIHCYSIFPDRKVLHLITSKSYWIKVSANCVYVIV